MTPVELQRKGFEIFNKLQRRAGIYFERLDEYMLQDCGLTEQQIVEATRAFAIALEAAAAGERQTKKNMTSHSRTPHLCQNQKNRPKP